MATEALRSAKEFRDGGKKAGRQIAAALVQAVKDEHAAGRLDEALADSLLQAALVHLDGAAGLVAADGHSAEMVRQFRDTALTTFRREHRRLTEQNRRVIH